MAPQVKPQEVERQEAKRQEARRPAAGRQAADAPEARFEAAAGAADAGARLDAFLARALPSLSRSRLKRLIAEGWVSLAGAALRDPAAKVKPGQIFAVAVPESAEAAPRAQAIPLAILYEDAHLIVIDKPAGLVVHPAAGNPDRTLVNALLAHCGDSLSGIGGVRRPGIVHRLDKDTSGLIVVAKTDAAHASLARQFEERSVERAYRAAVWGAPRPPAGEIAGAIGRSPRNRTKMAVVQRGGKAALTRYRVVARYGPRERPVASLLECRLATGRTHQIRVHLAAIGHPLLGDAVYGRLTPARRAALPPPARAALSQLNRQALDAYMLGFEHPASRERLRFEKTCPRDFKELIRSLEKL
jgi:23S rRNA pseudouridine1911/1915/1917 synthase